MPRSRPTSRRSRPPSAKSPTRSRGAARWTSSSPRPTPAGRGGRRLPSWRGALPRRHRPLPQPARRPALLLFGAAGAGADQADRRAEPRRRSTQALGGDSLLQTAPAVRRALTSAARAARSSRASARPYSRRRCAASRHQDAPRRVSRATALLGCGEQRREASPAPGAAEVQAIEMRDLAVAAVADDRGREQGRRLARRRRAAGTARTRSEIARDAARAMHNASISAGERNSSPPGSHAWQSRSRAEPVASAVADQRRRAARRRRRPIRATG